MQSQYEKSNSNIFTSNENQRKWTMVTAIIMVILTMGGSYLYFAWNIYQRMAEEEALQLAQSVESLLYFDHVVGLTKSSESQKSQGSDSLNKSLGDLVSTNSSIHYAYVLAFKDKDLVVVADSAGAVGPSSTPTKRSCEETTEINRLPFETGRSVITKPISTGCGNWVRALVPVLDPHTGECEAVLGLSYSASEWNTVLWSRIYPDIVIVVCLFFLALSILNLMIKQNDLTEKSKRLSFQEALYRRIFEQAPIGIALVGGEAGSTSAGFRSVNPTGQSILGRSSQELMCMDWKELTHPDDLEGEIEQFKHFINGEIDSYVEQLRVLRPDGSQVWVNVKIASFFQEDATDYMHICLLEDVSESKKAKEALEESERSKAVIFSHLPGMVYRCLHDRNWTMEFVSEGCRELTGYGPESIIENREVSFSDIISPKYRQAVWDGWGKVLPQGKSFHDEYEIITKTGERKWVLEHGQGIYDANGQVVALEGIVFDISEQKKRDQQITYLSERDALTGLYNRSYLEDEKKHLDQRENWPLSVLVCDINGLGLINDSYGHAEGDRLIVAAAGIMQSCSQQGDVLGRISGGEFMMIMPHANSLEAHKRKAAIQKAVKKYNLKKKQVPYKMNLSVGHGTKEVDSQSIDDVVRAAEEYLKHRKLLNQNSSHSAIVSSIMATLYAKSQETDEHGQRLVLFSRMIGDALCLDHKTLDDLKLLSMLHDIGKIGIDDRILNKPGKLTDGEWAIMREHPEIGYRIAMSTPQLKHIAKYILCHHERWDGKGYPGGLKGAEIPLAARIIAVADAYDAMTEDRVYRKALSKREALGEIRRGAGTQFDPEIAMLFVELMDDSGVQAN